MISYGIWHLHGMQSLSSTHRSLRSTLQPWGMAQAFSNHTNPSRMAKALVFPVNFRGQKTIRMPAGLTREGIKVFHHVGTARSIKNHSQILIDQIWSACSLLNGCKLGSSPMLQSHVTTRQILTLALPAQSELLWNPLPLRAKATEHRWQFDHCLPRCTWASRWHVQLRFRCPARTGW